MILNLKCGFPNILISFNLFCTAKFMMIFKVLRMIILIVAMNHVVTAFVCLPQCWHNDWGARDSEAAKHNLGHIRCDYSYAFGGRCWCYGPPVCIRVSRIVCAHNCWHNDWNTRDQRAREAGKEDKRCSYEYSNGGKCFCYGSPLCE